MDTDQLQRPGSDPEGEEEEESPDPEELRDPEVLAQEYIQEHLQPTSPSKWLTVEPAVFFLFFAVNLSSYIYTNNLLTQICDYYIQPEDRDACKYLGTANESRAIQDLEMEAQKYSANIIMVTSMLGSVVPAIVGFFLGPWSDNFGRKPVLVSGMVGFTLQYLITAMIAFLSARSTINPWWYILGTVPLLFTGGYTSLITVLFCYITDTTHEGNRSTRMIALETVLYLGILLGSLSSSQILNYMDAPTVFLICTGLCMISLVYVVFFIRESVEIKRIGVRVEYYNGVANVIPLHYSWPSKIRELFRLEHLSDMFEAAVRRRPDFCRCVAWLVISSMCLVMFILEGSQTVFFLFVREKFGWTVHDYALYDSYSIMVQVIGTILGIYVLKKLFRLSDPMIAVIAAGSIVLDGVAKSFAERPVDLYFAVVVSLFKSIFSPMARSILASMVSHDEIGKIYALVTAVEGFTPLMAAPLYSILYKTTISTLPNAFNILTGSLGLLCTLLMVTVYVLMQGMPDVTFRPISS